MRVAIVVASLAPGGSERFATLLASGLLDVGCDVTVVTLNSADSDVYTLPESAARVSLQIDRPPGRGRAAKLRRDLDSLRELRRAIRLADAEVVVALGWSTNVITILCTRLLRVPIVISERTDPREHKVGPWWSTAQRVTYPLATHLVVQTESVRRAMRRWVRPGRTSVIPNPVAREAFDVIRQPAPRPTVVAVGRLDRPKGFDVLIRAFGRVKNRVPNAELILIGDGPLRDELEQLGNDLGLSDAICFAGLQPDPSVLVRTAWCSCLSSRFEGFPNVLIEAMAVGIPVVATDCRSGPADILGGGEGILVPVDDVEELANAVTLVLTDSALASRLSELARHRARDFEHGVVIDLWAELLSAITNVHGQSAP